MAISFLVNWRRFPRARISLSVQGRSPGRIWHALTADMSLGGCRLVGRIPIGRGDRVAMDVTAPGMLERWSTVARVSRCDDDGASLSFELDAGGRERLRIWLRDATTADIFARRVLTGTPARLHLDSVLTAGASRPPRVLEDGEQFVLDQLDQGRTLEELRMRAGPRWEQRLQPVFSLVSEGIIDADQGGKVTVRSSPGFGQAVEVTSAYSATTPTPQRLLAADKRSWVKRWFTRGTTTR
jgi:hypothetical protein